MKSILLHVEHDECMEARLQVAMDLARAHQAHITFLQAVSYEVFAPGDFYGSAMAAALPKIKEGAEKLRDEIEADMANEDVSWEWRFLYGMAEVRLLEQSALHDLIIVGPHDIGEHGRGPSSMVGELVLKATAPVLVVPGDTKRLDADGKVLVAWNGSSEACVALKQSVALLKNASHVYLASVSEGDERERFEFPASEAAKYLGRHGIHAELVDIPKGDAKTADTLASAAKLRECSLMVMGAYGHSRLSEFLLGGVTRRALSDPHLPILLAH